MAIDIINTLISDLQSRVARLEEMSKVEHPGKYVLMGDGDLCLYGVLVGEFKVVGFEKATQYPKSNAVNIAKNVHQGTDDNHKSFKVTPVDEAIQICIKSDKNLLSTLQSQLKKF